MEGGSITGRQIAAGVIGTGTFNQTGGAVNSTFVDLGLSNGTGHYTLSNGSLTVGTLTVYNTPSAFTQTGGTLSAGTINEEAGTISLPSLTVGTGQNATTVNLSGGTLVAPTITLQSGGSLTLSGGLIDSSTINLNGGTLTLPTAILDGGSPVFSVPTPNGIAMPTINYNGGQLDVTTNIWGTTVARPAIRRRRPTQRRGAPIFMLLIIRRRIPRTI
jgi:hypothetical protein